jgi:hypothetical protein
MSCKTVKEMAGGRNAHPACGLGASFDYIAVNDLAPQFFNSHWVALTGRIRPLARVFKKSSR